MHVTAELNMFSMMKDPLFAKKGFEKLVILLNDLIIYGYIEI